MKKIAKRSKKFILIFASAMTAILIVIVAACILSFSGKDDTNQMVDSFGNILVLGVDAASNSTDVIMVMSISQENECISMLQIPRDTYVNYSGQGRKINSLYSVMLSQSENNSKEAVQKLSLFISENMGIALDKYILLDTNSVAKAIDAVGGISVNVPFDMYYEDKSQSLEIALEKGIRNLTGEQAVNFARYRIGYLDGDLGRLDAQKMLITSLYNKVTDDTSMLEKIKIAAQIFPSTTTNITANDALKIYNAVTEGDYSLRLMTAPGEAKRYNETGGAWYYVLNKKSMENAIKSYINQGRDFLFDKNEIFYDSENLAFKNIYFDKNFSVKVYTDENTPNLNFRQGG